MFKQQSTTKPWKILLQPDSYLWFSRERDITWKSKDQNHFRFNWDECCQLINFHFEQSLPEHQEIVRDLWYFQAAIENQIIKTFLYNILKDRLFISAFYCAKGSHQHHHNTIRWITGAQLWSCIQFSSACSTIWTRRNDLLYRIHRWVITWRR